MKSLTVTNGTICIKLDCTNKINTRISEECIIQLSHKNKINPEEIVLKVLLEELKIDNKEEWKLCG